MRTLYLFLLIYFHHIMGCLAQQQPLAGWAFGSYGRHQVDIFSPSSNVAAQAEVGQAGVAVGGQRRYGLPELDDY